MMLTLSFTCFPIILFWTIFIFNTNYESIILLTVKILGSLHLTTTSIFVCYFVTPYRNFIKRIRKAFDFTLTANRNIDVAVYDTTTKGQKNQPPEVGVIIPYQD